MSDPTGVLIIDKPTGCTSHDVVGRVRRALSTRKVGHAGTLDPAASGVLVVGVGRATRLLGYLTKADKRYEATVRLGARTTTDDAEGDVLYATSCAHLEEQEILEAFTSQIGELLQVPSAVSAVKVDGRRAYERVRSGETVELPARPVTVHALTISRMRREQSFTDVDIDVVCSSGTYIRAIGRDAGEKLKVGGHLTALRRTASGAFHIEEAIALQEIVETGAGADQWLLTPRVVAMRSMPWREVDAMAAQAIRHGQPMPWAFPDHTAGPLALVDATALLAIVEPRNGRLHYLAVFSD
jgi:tRNA pseudouridine55 synthase